MAVCLAGGDRDESLPEDWRCWGPRWYPAIQELLGWGASHPVVDPLSSDQPLAHSFSSFVQTSPPWGLMPNP